MKIIFLSKFYPRCLRNEYFNNSKSGLAAAADAHQYALALGFSKVCDNFEIVNLPALFPFPTRYKRMIERDKEILENGLRIHNLGFCNMIFLQNLSRYWHAKLCLGKVVEEETEICWIVIYSTNSAFLKSATKVKEQHKNVRLCMIVPDVPSDMEPNTITGRLSGALNQIGFSPFESYCQKMDAFVLLTDAMTERIPHSQGCYIVSEGIYDETGITRTPSMEDRTPFKVLYSGMLHKKFGVMNLVRAVHESKDKDIVLYIYGTGDAVSEIKDIAHKDKRIIYKGIAPREDVLVAQTQVSLLVNPRVPDNNVFTRYSFPSKTLEYLASGTPTLIYELDGIPSEYYQYCYHLDASHTDIDSLKEEIEHIKSVPFSIRKEKAVKAREFILREKNASVMCTKICDFLKGLEGANRQ